MIDDHRDVLRSRVGGALDSAFLGRLGVTERLEGSRVETFPGAACLTGLGGPGKRQDKYRGFS